MKHPAQYSRHKQGNSIDYISGSNSDKKESARASVETNKQTNKQTNSICQSREFGIYNFYWGALHSIVERSKEILPTTSMEVSQRRKKALEPPLKQTNKQYLSKFTTFIGAPCTV